MHRAPHIEPRVGLPLPSNVVIEERYGPGRSRRSAWSRMPKLEPMAAEVAARLHAWRMASPPDVAFNLGG